MFSNRLRTSSSCQSFHYNIYSLTLSSSLPHFPLSLFFISSPFSPPFLLPLPPIFMCCYSQFNSLLPFLRFSSPHPSPLSSLSSPFHSGYRHSSELICRAAIESIIKERFGSKCFRVFRLLLMKKMLEQKQVAEMAMIPSKEAKELLYVLMAENYVTLQVSREKEGGSNYIILYSLNYSRIKYFAVWLNSAEKQISQIKFSWSSASPVKCMRTYTTMSSTKTFAG